MWFAVAVLVLLGSSQVIAEFPDHVLPPIARWGWWTATLWGCGLASIYSGYARFHWKAIGLLSVMLFYASYPLLWDTYSGTMLATHAVIPWATGLVAANVVLPIIMVTIGPLLPVVRGAGE